MHNDIYLTLGRAVKDHRLGLGWSQEELGERSELHPSYVGQIERGTKKISLVTLQKLAEGLKVKPTDLLRDKPLKHKPSSWENKIMGIIRGRPAALQEYTYRLIKEALRAHPYRNRTR